MKIKKLFSKIVLIFSLTISSALIAVPAAAEDNMLINGEFTYWDWGWNQWVADWDADADIVFGGNYLDARVYIHEGGAFNWSIQFYQGNLNIEQGKTYELSFDSTTYGKTTLAEFDVVVEEDGGDYTHYMVNETVHVDPSIQHFVYRFTMEQATDPNARVTFNLGNNDGIGGGFSTVIGIDNVVLREIPGNQIVNGEFNDGLNGWASFIHPDAQATIYHSQYNDARVSVVDGGSEWWHVQLSQGGLKLEQGKTYELTFSVERASKSSSAFVDVVVEENGGDYTHYTIPERVYGGMLANVYTTQFTMLYPSDYNARLTFNMGDNYGPTPGPSATLWIDDVSLKEVE